MTDIAQLRASSSNISIGSDAAGSVSVGTPPQQPAAVRLRALARLSFSRTLGACWLIPLMDLYVRVKLNVIGGSAKRQQRQREHGWQACSAAPCM